MKNKELIVDNGKLTREGWEEKTWKQVVDIRNGKNQKKVENPSGKYPIYGSGGIFGYADEFLCPENTTIIGRKGSINNPIYVETKFWNVDTAFGLVSKEGLNPKFLHYFCLGFDFTLLNKSTTLPSLTKRNLSEIKIPLPPLPEQRRIVSKLDGLFTEIDASLALIDQNIEQTEALKLSVLDEEFGVKGKSWSNLTKVGKVLSAISTGTTPSKKIKDYYNSDDIEWFKPADFDDKRKYLKESRDNLSNKSIKDKKARIFKKDTLLLVAIGATIGKIGLVYKETGSANQQITGMNFKSKIFPEFSYYWFKYIKSTIVRNASSATLPILNQKGIKDLPFNYPDNIDDQQKIVQRLDALFEEIDGLVSDYQQKREDLEALKSSLLDQAFKGEL